jgi:hypothetical protein
MIDAERNNVERIDVRLQRGRNAWKPASRSARHVWPATVAVGPAVATSGFKSNKAFDTLPLFSGENSQSFHPWHEEFMSKAGIVGVHHDNLRELRLKLTGPARAHYY